MRMNIARGEFMIFPRFISTQANASAGVLGEGVQATQA
jgi:hypothetical protein